LTERRAAHRQHPTDEPANRPATAAARAARPTACGHSRPYRTSAALAFR
jgi:hypothetical protein